MLVRKQLHQLVLRTIRVLVLVDQQIFVAALVALAHLARSLQHAHGIEQKIVEIHGIILEQLVLIRLEEVRNPFAVRIFRAKKIILRIDHVILGPRNPPQHGARRELLDVEPHALHDLLHQALLIVLIKNREGSRQALAADLKNLDVAAQDAHAERVKGRDQGLRKRRVPQQLIHALGHLPGGLVGKSDRQDRIGRDIFLLDEPDNAVRNHARLARSRPRQDEQRPLGGFDRSALFGIEMIKERVQCVESGGKVPESSLPFGDVRGLLRHFGLRLGRCDAPGFSDFAILCVSREG